GGTFSLRRQFAGRVRLRPRPTENVGYSSVSALPVDIRIASDSASGLTKRDGGRTSPSMYPRRPAAVSGPDRRSSSLFHFGREATVGHFDFEPLAGPDLAGRDYGPAFAAQHGEAEPQDTLRRTAADELFGGCEAFALPCEEALRRVR